MLVVLDTCNLGLTNHPSGGVVVRVTDIEGLSGVSLLIPIEGKEHAQKFIDGMQEIVGPRVHTADLTTMKRVVRDEPQA